MAKILLFEDDAVQIELLKKLLEPRGHVLMIARNGQDGIKAAHRERPDLILMDMIMPGMHGLEATIKLKEDETTKEIPIMALTIMSTPKFVQECYHAGVISYIKKPYDPKVLLESVERVVGKPEKSTGQILIMAAVSRLATMIEMRLLRYGYEVKTLRAIDNAQDQLENVEAAAIFIDVSLPETQVARMFEALRAAEGTRSIPVVVFAAQLSREELGREAARWGTSYQIATVGELVGLLRQMKEAGVA